MMTNLVFALVAIASLAIGIGTNTAFYALYRGVFSSDRGFGNPSTLVKVSMTSPPGSLPASAGARRAPRSTSSAPG